jgi:hypothetical protein
MNNIFKINRPAVLLFWMAVFAIAIAILPVRMGYAADVLSDADMLLMFCQTPKSAKKLK